eukprot:SAG22_NODE_5238_length_1055_cov_1.407950_1_plen_170_part_10
MSKVDKYRTTHLGDPGRSRRPAIVADPAVAEDLVQAGRGQAVAVQVRRVAACVVEHWPRLSREGHQSGGKTHRESWCSQRCTSTGRYNAPMPPYPPGWNAATTELLVAASRQTNGVASASAWQPVWAVLSVCCDSLSSSSSIQSEWREGRSANGNLDGCTWQAATDGTPS